MIQLELFPETLEQPHNREADPPQEGSPYGEPLDGATAATTESNND